jgi:ribonuclease J
MAPGPAIPPTLDLVEPIDGLVISHPHQDHYGLLRDLPQHWPVWSGEAAEILMRMTAALRGDRIAQRFQTYHAWTPFTVGPFTVTPYLTDHSAFDAHMLLVDCGDRRILYSGDFRRVGRKAVLVDRLMSRPPKGVDVLLLEGTTLGRSEVYPTEAELEDEFVDLFKRTAGRVFVTWSAQNIDRTVTIYRACKRTGRTLILDLYTLDVLERLARLCDSLPRLGWPQVMCIVTASMKRLYDDPARLGAPDFVERCATSGNAIGAAKLAGRSDAVVMLRPSLLRDFARKGFRFESDDAWVFSMWSGYLQSDQYLSVRREIQEAGAGFHQIHTSGHASSADLEEFAQRVEHRCLVPIHSFAWNNHLQRFSNVSRLRDGEPFVVP